MYDCGTFSSLDTVELLLSKMKELAVVTVHKTIHMVHLWKMTQESDERIRAFAARITGKADLCEMTVDCPKTGCDTKASYRDEVVLQVLLQGMSDKDVRARTLTQTANGKLKKLADVVEYVSAEEAGILQSHDICHESAGIGGIRKSAYKRGDGQGNVPGNQRNKCSYCGEQSHGGKNLAKDREGSCKAWNVKCNKCQRLHHLASVCRSGKPASTAATTDVDTATATAEASAFNGFIASIVAAPPTSHSTLAPLVAHTSTDLPFILRPFKHYVNSPHFSEIVKPIHFKRHLLLQRHPGGKGQVLVLIHV